MTLSIVTAFASSTTAMVPATTAAAPTATPTVAVPATITHIAPATADVKTAITADKSAVSAMTSAPTATAPTATPTAAVPATITHTTPATADAKTAITAGKSAVPAMTPVATSSIDIRSCTGENGALGDANPQLRDFCLSQTSDVEKGKAHHVIHFAMEYYNVKGCSAPASASDANCNKAANSITAGVMHAFHLNHKTLHKIRDAVEPGAENECPCSDSK